jgi:hypothetical protein
MRCVFANDCVRTVYGHETQSTDGSGTVGNYTVLPTSAVREQEYTVLAAEK